MAPHSPPSSRRPLPQPVEESQRSNRGSSSTASQAPSNPTSPSKHRRSLPQPVETSSKSSKTGGPVSDNVGETSRDPVGVTSSIARVLPQSIESSLASNVQSSKPRRFAPQVIETSRRSSKSSRSDSDTTPLASPALADSLGEFSKRPRYVWPSPSPTTSINSPIVNLDYPLQAPASRFSSTKLTERAPRRHSFRVPDLPAIPSTIESNESDPSTPDPEDYAGWRRRRKNVNKRASQARESQDETTSGYLLSLAARAAEKQLKEQVMAAYPNENLHEPVDHYAGDRDSEEESDFETGVGQLSMREDGSTNEAETFRIPTAPQHRDSESGEGGWGLAELRKHRDKLEKQNRDAWESEPQAPIPFSDIGASDPNAEFRQRAALAGEKIPMAGAPPKHWQTHNELKSMAKAASPPMAGQNLRFPRCQSPRNTRLDVHQYPGQRKPTTSESRKQTGLWTPKGGNTLQNTHSGLWMGVNALSAQEQHVPPRFIRTGLMTPAVEREDPFSAESSVAPSRRSSYVPASSLPPSPPSSQEEEGAKKAAVKKPCVPTTDSPMKLEDELNDAFVTQVYNYLSLGYPSLARPYDEELGKIARMDVETLRNDDRSGNSKGYVGAPEGTGLDVRGCREGACQRWLALKKYIEEWGRQQSLMRVAGGVGWENGDDQGGWGARARKGSWAI